MKHKIVLGLIFGLALLVRAWSLDTLPQRMFGDEVDAGYHAWSLWTTGRDYMGQIMPTYIRSLSEYRAPLFMYFMAPFVGIMGPSNWSVRLPSVVTGILSVWFIYLVCLKLFAPWGDKKSKVGATVAAFVLAVSPWHIHYSRTAFEVSMLVFLILLSLCLYFYIDVARKSCWFLIPLALTFYTYSTANIFVPLMIVGLVFFDKKLRTVNRQRVAILAMAFLIALPSGLNLINGRAGARFGLISIFNNQKIIDEVIVARTKPWSNSNDLIFNNKPVRISQEFLNNYLGAWSPEFLFIKGDSEPRHNVFGFGEFSIGLLPLFILGMAAVITGKARETRLIAYLLLIAPISSSLTYGGGDHATRLFVFLPFLAICMGIGAMSISGRAGRLVLWACIAVALISLVGWWRQMSQQYVYETERSWQYGYQEIFEEFAKIDDGKGRVYINNTKEPTLTRFSFYTKLPPKDFQMMFRGDQMKDMAPGLIGFEFGDRYVFGRMLFEDIRSLKTGDYFIAAQGQEIPGDMDLVKSPLSGFETLKKVSDSYGLPLFYILRKNASD